MFKKATPVWLRGMNDEMNLFAAFETETDSLADCEIRIAAAYFYRLFVNGKFAAFGPARTAKGYARTDIIALDTYNENGKNTVRIEVAGYNCRSMSTCKTNPFLIAEIVKNGDVIAYTGKDFVGSVMSERVRAVERYSQQRHFAEVLDYTQPEVAAEAAPAAVSPKLLDRVAPYPVYRDIVKTDALCRGTFAYDETLPVKKNRYSFPPEADWGNFAEDEIKFKPFRWIQSQNMTPTEYGVKLPATLSEGEYVFIDLSQIECGFIGFDAFAEETSDVVIGFTEYCEPAAFKFHESNLQNVLEYVLKGGKRYAELAFEPAVLRSAVILVRSGKITLESFGVKTFERTTEGVFTPEIVDPELKSIYNAAIRSFSHNAVDIYSDCPSRERAGWLCDSFFSGRIEHFFFGDAPVERAFLENYRLFDSAPKIPEGMMPNCYPSDTEHGGLDPYIPQWCLWYILEVRDYVFDRGGESEKELFRKSVTGILDFCRKYENADGLLEKVPGWNFVEWSNANKWTNDVNYPTNFLYAEALSRAYELYGDESLEKKAEHIRKTAARMSFDGELFTDNAVRDADGVLKNTGNTSEACQYYAILFGRVNIDDEKYARLKGYIFSRFKEIKETREGFVPVNAFIGFYLRIMCLEELKYYDILLEDIKNFFKDMIAKTNTLWEYMQMKGSFDHSFAAYVACIIHRALASK